MANQVAYGFYTLKDVFAKRVTEVGLPVVARAIQATVDEHNRQIAALMSLFVQRTTEAKLRYKTPVNARLQPVDEQGRARPIRMAGHYDVAWPIQMGAAALGTTFLSKAKMTVEEANEDILTLTSADIRWVRDHILAALYANASWAFVDEKYGSLTIEGLANGDSVVYPIMAGADAGATDSHYLAQAAAIADGANPYPTIYTELTEHPDNSGEVIAFIPSGLRATTEALATFYDLADPNIRVGVGTAQLVGTLGVTVPGKLVGYVGGASKTWIVEWPVLPANYIIAVMSGGERPLAMREDPEAELQGFRRVADRDDYPFYEGQWLRRAGFGARNRTGALVYRIGNATYDAPPTGYTSPMP